MAVVWRAAHAGYRDNCPWGVSLVSLRGIPMSWSNYTSYIFVEWQLWVTPTITQVPISYLIPINLAILIFAGVYMFALALDAINAKNNILLFAICISNACSFAYAVMQYHLMESNTLGLYEGRYGYPTLVDTTRSLWPSIQPAEIVVCIIAGLGSLAMIPCVYFLHKEYSWAIYKCVNGNRKTRMRYLFYEVRYFPPARTWKQARNWC